MKRTSTLVKCLIIVPLILFYAAVGYAVFADSIIGSDMCVISSDYNSISFCGNTYVPFDSNGLDYDMGEVLVDEARVEGEGFFGKLFFGDKIYGVRGCFSTDLILLQTDYDLAPSEIYCLEEKAGYYEAVCSDFQPSECYAEIITRDWDYVNIPLDSETSECITGGDLSKINVRFEYSRGDGEEWIDVKLFGSDGIFYEVRGLLLCKNGKYYFDDKYKGKCKLPEDISDEMAELFGYMFE